MIQKPPTAQNYAIGCFATSVGNEEAKYPEEPEGYIEGTGVLGLEPVSLFEAQLAERLRLNPTTRLESFKHADVWSSVLLEKNQLRFNLPNNLKYVIEIFSLDGQSLIQKKGFGTEASIALESIGLSPGIYWVRVIQAKNSIENKFYYQK